jgi:hypothetical protein
VLQGPPGHKGHKGRALLVVHQVLQELEERQGLAVLQGLKVFVVLKVSAGHKGLLALKVQQEQQGLVELQAVVHRDRADHPAKMDHQGLAELLELLEPQVLQDLARVARAELQALKVALVLKDL